jgi:hypothetical protein
MNNFEKPSFESNDNNPELKVDRFENGEDTALVSVDLMKKDIEKVLSENIQDPQEVSKVMDQIMEGLESSDSIDDFKEKYDKMYNPMADINYNAVGKDKAFSRLKTSFLPIFSHYFANRDGYKDMDLYLKEKYNAGRVNKVEN